MVIAAACCGAAVTKTAWLTDEREVATKTTKVANPDLARRDTGDMLGRHGPAWRRFLGIPRPGPASDNEGLLIGEQPRPHA